MIRPTIGQQVSATDRLIRSIESTPAKYGRNERKVWTRYGEMMPGIKPKPLTGIYVGFRTYSDGKREWDSEAGYIFYPEKYFEVWLIVPSERQNPIAVFPSDVATADAGLKK